LEFRRFVRQLHCPRCGNKLQHNIWPYSFPFDPPDGFEERAAEIAQVARRTPFLVLKHPLAIEILDAVGKTAEAVVPQQLTSAYYRGRLAAGVATMDLASFDRAPASLCKEGRYNHAGSPVLYLASDRETCIRELSAQDEPVLLAELAVEAELRILDLLGGERGFASEVLNALVFSSLVSAPRQSEGWDRPEYIVSRFVADCARSAGFDAIRYPSVREGNGHNLAILSNLPSNRGCLRLIGVHRVPSGG
jgi:RES domain-containing protein